MAIAQYAECIPRYKASRKEQARVRTHMLLTIVNFFSISCNLRFGIHSNCTRAWLSAKMIHIRSSLNIFFMQCAYRLFHSFDPAFSSVTISGKSYSYLIATSTLVLEGITVLLSFWTLTFWLDNRFILQEYHTIHKIISIDCTNPTIRAWYLQHLLHHGQLQSSVGPRNDTEGCCIESCSASPPSKWLSGLMARLREPNCTAGCFEQYRSRWIKSARSKSWCGSC